MYRQFIHCEFTWYKFHSICVLHLCYNLHSCHSLTLLSRCDHHHQLSELRYYLVYTGSQWAQPAEWMMKLVFPLFSPRCGRWTLTYWSLTQIASARAARYRTLTPVVNNPQRYESRYTGSQWAQPAEWMMKVASPRCGWTLTYCSLTQIAWSARVS